MVKHGSGFMSWRTLRLRILTNGHMRVLLGDNFQEWASTDLQHRFIVKEVTHKGNTACLPVLERHPESTSELCLEPAAQHALNDFVCIVTDRCSNIPFVDPWPKKLLSVATLVFTEVRAGPDAIPQHAFELPSFCKKPVIGHGIV